ncbi:MAG: TRIC cation channel family protein, partial [Betaproteobacteria bacterium]|nr:TRIC cation channel family protein [Betaproteobacteria bacterium]
MPEEAPAFPVLEGASLALATVLGTHTALAIGAPPVGSVVIGCIAGTVGGMLRDLCLNERPALLETDFYGSAVVVGAMAVTGLHALHADLRLQMAAGGVCVFGLRLLGTWRMKRLGKFSEF